MNNLNIFINITDVQTASLKKTHRKCIRIYGLLATYSCVRAATKCFHGARQWCSRGAVGDLIALLRRPRRSHCAATATLRCSYCANVTTPSHGAHFEHAQSARRGMETEETTPRPMAMPRRSSCALGDPTACITAFCIFPELRTDSVMTQLWCDRPLSQCAHYAFRSNSFRQ